MPKLGRRDNPKSEGCGILRPYSGYGGKDRREKGEGRDAADRIVYQMNQKDDMMKATITP